MRDRNPKRNTARATRWGVVPLLAWAALVWCNGDPARAEPINFFPTGNAERDMSRERFPDVVILIDNPRFPNRPTNDVAQAPFMTEENWLTGWNIKDLRFLYDVATDRMGVAVNFFKNPDGTAINIAGDADGDGDPNRSDPRTLLAGGIDQPNFGGTESITVALDLNQDGIPDVVAGIPAEKNGDGLSAFTVARFRPATVGEIQAGIERSYGEPLSANIGELTYVGTRDAPDFQFTIEAFSTLPGYTVQTDPDGVPFLQFGVRAYAGSLEDVVAGEDLFFLRTSPQIIPEPTSLLILTVLGGLTGAWSLTRGRQRGAFARPLPSDRMVDVN